MRTLAAVVLLVVSAAACTSVEGGDVLFEPRDAPDSGPDAWLPEPTFAWLDHHVFRPKCTAPCHSGGAFAAGNFDMGGDTYASMIDVPAAGTPTNMCAETGLLRIDQTVLGLPGERFILARSLVWLKVKAKADDAPAVCGEGMPQGANRAPLTPEEMAALAEWIADGAPP